MDHKQERQRPLPFDEAYDRARETRAERIERLLGSLGMKPSTINTSQAFDFEQASRIARRKNNA